MIEYDYKDIDFANMKDKDKFERYKYLTFLENLIISQKETSFVLQISGQYGSGKTFFVNLLNKYLSEQGYNTLYYNAWEHDYAQDAFISFCTTFIKHFETSPNKEGFKEATKKLFVNNIPTMLTYCFKEIFNKYTGISIDTSVDAMCNFSKDVDENSQKIQKACNDLLESELNRQDVVEEFRVQLTKLITSNINVKPLVIFIDDLDRCKPEFAIRLLDYIKHLFNIKGVTFVLAVDDEQLKSTVQQFYGAKNATGYLKRIVDFDFRLPMANYKDYIGSLFREYNFPNYSRNDYFINLLNNLGFLFDLSLRDFNHVFNQVHKIMRGHHDYDNKPYMYFVVYIIKNYFYKFKDEIDYLETEESKKYNTVQKLYRLFNKKMLQIPYYTYSLFDGTPLNKESRQDYNLQEIMFRLAEVSQVDNSIFCYTQFPSHVVYLNSYDPYGQKTIYDRILEDMESASKDKKDN